MLPVEHVISRIALGHVQYLMSELVPGCRYHNEQGVAAVSGAGGGSSSGQEC